MANITIAPLSFLSSRQSKQSPHNVFMSSSDTDSRCEGDAPVMATRDDLLESEPNGEEEPLVPPEPDHSVDRRFRVRFLVHLLLRAVPSLLVFGALGGVYIGFNGLKPVMIDQHMFHFRCSSDVPLNETCPEQVLLLNSVFQFASGSVGVCGLIVGVMNDWLSQTLLFYISAVVNLLGFGLFGALVHFRFFDQYFWWLSHLCNFLMGLSGSGLFLAFLKWMFLVPKDDVLSRTSGFVNAGFTAAWNVGAAVFWFFNLMYFYVWPNIFVVFEVYVAVFLVLSFVLGLFLRYPKFIRDQIEASHPPKAPCKERMLKWFQFWVYACDWQFFIVFVWMSFAGIQLTFYISTMYDQVFWISNNRSVAGTYCFVFSLMLALIGVAAVAPFGFLVNYHNISVVVLFLMDVVWTALSCVESIYVQIPLYVFISIHRAFLYTLFYRIVSVRWESRYFGVSVSLLLALSGGASFLSIPLNRAVESFFSGSFVMGNIVSGAIGLLGHGVLLIIPLVNWLSACIKCIQSKKAGKKEDESGMTPRTLATIQSLDDGDLGTADFIGLSTSSSEEESPTLKSLPPKTLLSMQSFEGGF